MRVGIIGAGGIVENSHLPILKNRNDIKVSWIYDKNIERSKLLGSMYNVPVIGEEKVENAINDIDICLLAIPYGARSKYIELCALKQKALYVEKPFAKTLQEHQYYCSLFSNSNIAVGFQRRYYKIVDSLQSIIASGIIGNLKKIKFKQGYFALKGGSSYLSDAALAGGGVIVESAIHALDQILLAINATAVKVLEVKSICKNGIDYDTVFNSEITTFSDTIKIDCEVSALRNLENGLEFHFENGILKCQLSCNTLVEITGAANKPINFAIESCTYSAGSISESFFIFWDEFVKSITTAQENLTSATSSLLTTSWIEQIYQKIS